MAPFSSWTTSATENIREHEVVYLVAPEQRVGIGVAWAASELPNQYAHPNRISRILASLGKPAASEFLKTKVPNAKTTRSGDLGEILGAQYAAHYMGFRMVERLRWKDHAEMAMRGDDLVGLRLNSQGKLDLLKGEAKSREKLATTVVKEADAALRSDDGLPSAHSLSFVSDRLSELGEETLSDRIDEAQLGTGISQEDVVQLLFTFTGNDPRNLLQNNTKAYKGNVKRVAVGLHVSGHQEFISEVYSQVTVDG